MSHTLSPHTVWAIHEQVCVAALDCGDYSLAEVCNLPSPFWQEGCYHFLLPQRSLEALRKRFPDSERVTRLEGMCVEASGEYVLCTIIVHLEFCSKWPTISCDDRSLSLVLCNGKYPRSQAYLPGFYRLQHEKWEITYMV